MNEQQMFNALRALILARLQLMGYSFSTDYNEEDATVTAVYFAKEDGSTYTHVLYPQDFLRDNIVEHVVMSINNMLKYA